MKKSNVKEIQARFLDEMAMRGAISASVSETKVYTENTSNDQKENAKKKWEAYIREIAKGYKSLRSRDDFISDVIRLQDMINSDQNINHIFCKLDEYGNIIADEYGIRIAQCQKSLSIYLKYLWCYGLIKTPPVCPIDRVILSICKEYYRQNTNIADSQEKIELCSKNWTRLDDINVYRRMVEITEEVAGSQICTAEWELVKWNESVISQTTGQERSHKSSSVKRKEDRPKRKGHSTTSQTPQNPTIVQNTHEIFLNKKYYSLFITKGIELTYRDVPILVYYGVDRSTGETKQICKVSIKDECHNTEELFRDTNVLSILNKGRNPHYKYQSCASEAEAKNLWKEVLQELNIQSDLIIPEDEQII